jgi:Ca2+-binding RTX toxin-like protein
VRPVIVLLAFAAFAIPGSGASLAAAPTAPAETIGPFTGVVVGTLDRTRNIRNSEFTSRSEDFYKGRFTYSFRIVNGVVQGTGHGDYLEASWKLAGTTDDGAFSCTVPMRTRPFGVKIIGRLRDGVVRIFFGLEGARESNSDHYCGANFTGYASDDDRLNQSLIWVQGTDGISFRLDEPRIPVLREVERTGDASDNRVNIHHWTFTIRGPGATPPPTNTGTGGVGAAPAARAAGPCTITGTPGNDTLTGTPGRDVICGRGGNDLLVGGDGHDSLRGEGGRDRLVAGKGNDALDGGPGADTLLGQAGRDLLLARDGTRDMLDGGAESDRASRDPVDRVRGVESG